MRLQIFILLLAIIASEAVPAPQSVEVFGADSSSTYSTNDLVLLLITFDSSFTDVTGTCSPTLSLNTGVQAQYLSRDEFNWMVSDTIADDTMMAFQYVVNNEQANPLNIAAPKSTALDLTGCGGVVTGDLTGLSITPNVIIDTQAPSITVVTTRQPDGNYTAGTIIDILITFSANIAYDPSTDQTENPASLVLNTAAQAVLTGYAFSSDLTTLAFRYVVSTGENATLLDAASNTSLQLNEMTIYGYDTGLNADVTVPVNGQVGSLTDSASIVIVRTGQKFPPAFYNPSSLPTYDATFSPVDQRYEAPHSAGFALLWTGDIATSHLSMRSIKVASNTAVQIAIVIQIGGIFNVNEAQQTFDADILMVSSWTDSRFNDPTLDPITQNTTAILSQIWNPSLTFVNSRAASPAFDGKVVVHNTGRVELWQRFITTFATSIDARLFPFDTQSFEIKLRSTSYDNTKINFLPFNSPAQNIFVQGIQDPAWTFYQYEQKVSTTTTGLLANFQVLTTSVQGTRIATFNAMNILLPLCLLCFFCVVSYMLPFQSGARLGMPVQSLTATLAFSIVLSQYSPPVSYVTRMGLFVVESYAFSIVTLFSQIFMHQITSAVKHLSEHIKKHNKVHNKKKNKKWKKEIEDKVGLRDDAQKITKKKLKAKDTECSDLIASSAPCATGIPIDSTEKVQSDVPAASLKVKGKTAGNSKKKLASAKKTSKHLDLSSLVVSHYFGLMVITLENTEKWLALRERINSYMGRGLAVCFIVVTAALLFSR